MTRVLVCDKQSGMSALTGADGTEALPSNDGEEACRISNWRILAAQGLANATVAAINAIACHNRPMAFFSQRPALCSAGFGHHTTEKSLGREGDLSLLDISLFPPPAPWRPPAARPCAPDVS